MNEEPVIIRTPADYINGLLSVLKGYGGCTVKNDGEHIRCESDWLQMHMRRIILAKGFELFVNRYRLDRRVCFQVRPCYDALDVLAYFDNDTSELCGSVGYSFSFWKEKDAAQNLRRVVYDKSSRTYVTLYIDAAHLHQYLNLSDLKGSTENQWCELPARDSSNVFSVMRQIIDNDWERQTQRLYYHAKSLELVSLIASAVRGQGKAREQDDGLPGADMEALNAIREIIQENFESNLTIEGLSKLVFKNTYWLKTAYKATYGTTIHQDIINFRMNKALQLLQVEGLGVEETARKVGYDNQSHFISTFRKHYGLTPGELLRRGALNS